MYKIKQFLKKILPSGFINFYHLMQSRIACVRFGFPAQKMIIIGVTGTNGKTTVVNLISSILQGAGYKTAHISSVNFRIGDELWPNLTKMTTISAFHLQSFLAKALKADCQYVVVETTSHAIDQNRVWGIPYDILAFTNLTHDHLDYHHSMTEYRDSKGKLFAKLMKFERKPGVKKVSVINAEDPTFEYFWQFPADKKYSYRIGPRAKADHEIIARHTFSDIAGSQFVVETPFGSAEFVLALPGKFNIENALAAICVGLSQNIDLKYIKVGLERLVQVPGRMEKIEEGQDFGVIVDYAHTPDALQKIYQTVKPLVPGKIISVLGATGDRDKTKRPIMGALASQWTDIVIVTDEDPYHERPKDIIDQVAAGVPRGKKNQKMVLGQDYYKILNRQKAIKKAIQLAEKDDLVVITGKGAEMCMAVGDKKIPWDERQIVRDELKKHLKK